METAIYFKLDRFVSPHMSWYNLDFEGNQVAVAYTSIMITSHWGSLFFMTYATPGFISALLLRRFSSGHLLS